ncbi:MAG TPA: RIP metalloprotease RseP [Sphingomonadales bacterium]|nr:RIP metalloprotease RseP [Sphingomonadales bacterium]
MDGNEPGFAYTLIQFLVLLTVLVFVHEWGHYALARLFGVRVETFSIGFGRELFGWTDKKKTRWKVSWIPLGGYVKFFGDAGVASNPEKTLAAIPPAERSVCFHFKPLWQRALIVAAGPVINLVFAVVLYTGLLTGYGEVVFEPVVTAVETGSPAEAAGLQPGDRIVAVEGKTVATFDQIAPIVNVSAGKPLRFTIARGTGTLEFTIVPALVEAADPLGDVIPIGRIGISSGEYTVRTYSLAGGVVESFRKTGEMIALMGQSFVRIIKGEFSKEELGGPVKIAQYTGEIASRGLAPYLAFMALISINLGLINLLPIPVLDGGHLLFYAIEGVKGAPLSAKTQEMAAMIGLAFVLGLLFVVTWNDLKLPSFG